MQEQRQISGLSAFVLDNTCPRLWYRLLLIAFDYRLHRLDTSGVTRVSRVIQYQRVSSSILNLSFSYWPQLLGLCQFIVALTCTDKKIMF